jgi:hypothetical protein
VTEQQFTGFYTGFLYGYGVQSILLCVLTIALSVASACYRRLFSDFEPVRRPTHCSEDRALRLHIHPIPPQYVVYKQTITEIYGMPNVMQQAL